MGERLEFEHCFVCGPKNPVGLHLDIHREDKRTWCRWKVATAHMEIDFRTPAYAGDLLDCEGHVTEMGQGRAVRLEGTIRRGDTVIVQARSVMVIVDSSWGKRS